MNRQSYWIVMLLAAGSAWADAPATSDQQQLDFFEKKIRPVLVQHCYECHAADAKELRGGLRVDFRDSLRTGGDSGPAVVPRDIKESLLITALRYDDLEMPPKGKLPASVVADFEEWIRNGAVDPRHGNVAANLRTIDIEAGRAHWAYQPFTAPAVPEIMNTSWPINDVDRFILAKLEEQRLQPIADAEKIVLVRRLYFDLIGLPPTPAQIDEFVNDFSTHAYERLVDQLLTSPHFGQRWGRHWLDVVRYAESLTLRGFVLTQAWRYRDYVIESFNDDRPFDRFLVEQLAGDLVTESSLDARRRNLTATTFLMMGNTNLEDQDKQQLEMDFVDEQLDVIGRGLLAQTITCARCHDHKFDPIPTRDYYALAGILKNVKSLNHANVSKWIEVPLPLEGEAQLELEAHQQTVAELENTIAKLKQQLKVDAKQAVAQKLGTEGNDKPADKRAAKAALAAREAELKQIRKAGPERPMVMSVVENGSTEDLKIHIRGSVHNLANVAPRGVLQVATIGDAPQMPTDSSGRLELARWIVDPRNPLTSRVMVNRVWHWLMGAGLVRTVDNFGTTGELPSHPKLIDHLAVQFVAQGWSVKQLIRTIVLSRTYRLSSATAPHDDDPENRWLSRTHRSRMDAESLRDAMLSAAGMLNLKMGGRSYPADLSSDYSFEYNGSRRSVYAPVFRNRLPELFDVFDFANPSMVTGHRDVSTVAPQALFLMNSPFVRTQAQRTAERLLAELHEQELSRIESAYLLTLGRPATAVEIALSERFLQAVASDAEKTLVEAWTQLVQSLFSTIEFRYLR